MDCGESMPCQTNLLQSSAVEKTGGKALQPKPPIGPEGYSAIILDCEGNRIALRSPSA